jgi:hypothetical protein
MLFSRLTQVERDAIVGPRAGLVIYNTDSAKLEVYDGSSWVILGLAGGGFTQGSVMFADASGIIDEDNANFFWDDTNNRLGLGNAIPSTTLDVTGTITYSGNLNTPLTANRVPEINGSGVLTSSAVTDVELGYVSGVTSAIQTQIDGKLGTTLTDANIFVGNGSNVATGVNPSGDVDISNTGVMSIQAGVIEDGDIDASAGIAFSKMAALTANRATETDASGFVIASSVTNTELGYVSGVTSAIQTQFTGKLGTTLTDSNIFVGNGSNIATGVAMSGDGAISNTGVFSISSGVIVDGDVDAAANITATKLGTGVVDNTEFNLLNGRTGTLLDNTNSVTVTGKDIDGGTASNTSRITIPKDTTTNLNLLTDKEATLAYDTTLNEPVYNDGTQWVQFSGLVPSGVAESYMDVSGTCRPPMGTSSEGSTWNTANDSDCSFTTVKSGTSGEKVNSGFTILGGGDIGGYVDLDDATLFKFCIRFVSAATINDVTPQTSQLQQNFRAAICSGTTACSTTSPTYATRPAGYFLFGLTADTPAIERNQIELCGFYKTSTAGNHTIVLQENTATGLGDINNNDVQNPGDIEFTIWAIQ